MDGTGLATALNNICLGNANFQIKLDDLEVKMKIFKTQPYFKKLCPDTWLSFASLRICTIKSVAAFDWNNCKATKYSLGFF